MTAIRKSCALLSVGKIFTRMDIFGNANLLTFVHCDSHCTKSCNLYLCGKILSTLATTMLLDFGNEEEHFFIPIQSSSLPVLIMFG